MPFGSGSFNELFVLFSFISVTLGSTPKGKEVEQCKCSLACSCSCVYFSTSSCSDYVWNEQSKNCPLHLYGSTFVESGLGQWKIHVQRNNGLERTETKLNGKQFFDAYSIYFNKSSLFWVTKYYIPFSYCVKKNTALFQYCSRDGEDLDELLERQADMIRYLQQHNANLGRRILELQAGAME